MKTQEELAKLKEEVKALSEKLSTLTDEELAEVTGGNSWNEDWGEDYIPCFYDFCCFNCGNVLYRTKSAKDKTCEDGYYLCPKCNRMTQHYWKYVSLRG